MRIIVDGYNLLPVTGVKDREALIVALGAFAKARGHDLTVVFDGTHQGTGMGDRYAESGIWIVYTPLTVTADDHIIDELLEGAVAASTLVVSTDRKIQKAAAARAIQSMDSQEFARKLADKGAPAARARESDDDRSPREKRGNPRKLSKKERARRRTSQKI